MPNLNLFPIQIWGGMKQAHFWNRFFSVFHVALILFFLSGLVGCGNTKFSSMNAIGTNITPIRQLTPQQKDSTVYIQGKIEKQIPLLNKNAYLLNDSTGKILVLTNQSDLRIGSEVVFKGQLRYKSIPLAGEEQGEIYLEEK
ncbi:hypothetical protein [Calothrix sp. UHCC 0171]|uniref:hypothetical protein n=1 Tax=Calothrix sp. UHCC 0171 TaxID=3110245 RepID=UPI002B20694F|nr:hypothetical protein [Calothrix sp. UHCC 0171]MEA5569533.1 hypothetical protein [Calothrix sp. UHCC 0171]